MGAEQGGNEERDAELNQGRLGKTSGERGQAELRQKEQRKSPESEGWMCKVKCGPFGESKKAREM